MVCRIFSAGDCAFKEGDIRIDKDDFVIAADAGVRHCRMLGINPDLYLGDFDSASEEEKNVIDEIAKKDPKKVVFLPAVKDDTDTRAAIREGWKRGYRKFVLYGALGGRLDHTLANIQCLQGVTEDGGLACIVDKDVRIDVLTEDRQMNLEETEKGIISVFSLGERAELVTIEGLKYEMKNGVILNTFPVGVSNEFVGKKAMIKVEKGQLLVIRYLAGEDA